MVYAGYSRIGRGNVGRRHKPKDEDYKALCRSSKVGEGIRREGGRGRSGSRREFRWARLERMVLLFAPPKGEIISGRE